MTVIEIGPGKGLSARQRWGHNLVLLFAVSAFVIGVNLRDSALNAVWIYTNTEAGIRAEYPQNWLIDTNGDYVFRVRDVSETGYPTTIQVSVRPVGPETPPRYVFDALTLSRSQTLASYNVLSSNIDIVLPDESLATIMNYTFAATENDPFLESVPIVIRGQDILTVRRGQAIIITFLTESVAYQQNYTIFERFISSLEF
jgi:hypothetical protein